MKNIKLLLVTLLASFSANAQDFQKNVYFDDNQDMILILNSEMIGNIGLLKSIPSDQVHELNIFQEKKLSSKDNLFLDGKVKSGLITAKADFSFEAKTQEDLNKFFGLNPDTDLYVNGFLLEDKKFKISSTSIAKIEVIEPDNVFLDKQVLNITLK